MIDAGRKVRDAAIGCPRHKKAGLSGKSDLFFENAIITAKAGKGISGISGGIDPCLPLAIITETAGFQDRPVRHARKMCRDITGARDRGKFRCGNAKAAGEGFFGNTVLGCLKRGDAGADRCCLSDQRHRRRWYILKLAGDGIDLTRKSPQRGIIIIVSTCRLRCNVCRRCIPRRGKNMTTIPQFGSGDRCHPAKLATAENADHAAFRQRLGTITHQQVLPRHPLSGHHAMIAVLQQDRHLQG